MICLPHIKRLLPCVIPANTEAGDYNVEAEFRGKSWSGLPLTASGSILNGAGVYQNNFGGSLPVAGFLLCVSLATESFDLYQQYTGSIDTLEDLNHTKKWKPLAQRIFTLNLQIDESDRLSRYIIPAL